MKLTRFFGHFEGDAMTYRAPDEVAKARANADPLTIFRQRVVEASLLQSRRLRCGGQGDGDDDRRRACQGEGRADADRGGPADGRVFELLRPTGTSPPLWGEGAAEHRMRGASKR